jgi:para-nitrobenzyl esterase
MDAAVNRQAEIIVETASGKIRGITDRGIHCFRAVPYGATTAGSNRLLPPQPPKPWAGVRDALKNGPSAPQTAADGTVPTPPGARTLPHGGFPALFPPQEAGESEDCLHLNIWTPGLEGKRPVMVWLHGGGFFSGSGTVPLYDGGNLARRGDVVIVNVTHRLHVFGFLHLAEFAGAEFAHSGNVGMLDMVEALRWVRDNISRFGGDPNNVMIFGESGGAGKVSVLMAMPAAKGLFHRAAAQSGASQFANEAADAVEIAELFLAEVGLKPNQARDLQKLSTQAIMDGYVRFIAKNPLGPRAFMPLVEGDVLPGHPFYPTAPSCSRDIPFVLGTTSTESAFMYLGAPEMFELDDDGLRRSLSRALSPTDIDAAIKAYKRRFPTATPTELFLRISTDRSMRRNTQRVADARAGSGCAATYLYHLRYPSPVMGGRAGCPHTMDLPLMFDNATMAGIEELSGGARANRMAAVMADAWIAFARSGSPKTPALDWTAYTLARRETMILDETSRLEADPDRALRRHWDMQQFALM